MLFNQSKSIRYIVFSCLFSASGYADQPLQIDELNVYGKHDNIQQDHLDDSFFEPFTRDKIVGEDLRNEMVTDVKSALREVANVSVTDSGAFSKNVEIRGLSGDRITYIVDDVAIGNQGMTHAGGGEINLLDVGRVESIEVIKGSPSVIYSPGATGGVVSVTTTTIETESHIAGAVELSYDEGYEKNREAARISVGHNGLGLSVTGSRIRAEDYKIENQEKLDAIILRTNVLDERLGTDAEITDLGFGSESTSIQLKYQIDPLQHIRLQHSEYDAEDISFTHGSATARVFHYDELSRRANKITYYREDRGNSKTSISLYNQILIKDIQQGAAINRTQLDSQGFNLKTSRYFYNSVLHLGIEAVFDDAETNTFSEQVYYAAYASYDLSYSDQLTYTAGLRANRWEVEQNLKPGQNPSLVGGLVGISGQLDPQEEDAFTYALGVIYSANDSNNFSANYSHTHRYPTLMERFAFDVFVGGGVDLEAETADNIELGWKYNNGHWYAAAAIFYSRFDNFINATEVRTLTDESALITCINQGDCNPATGDYDDRDPDFFDIKVFYGNAGQVDNRGIEFSLKKIINGKMEMGFSFGLNEFSAEEAEFISDSRPLEFKGYYKHYFSELPGSPWVKTKARYVTDEPSVKQREGFDPFLVADLYIGGEYKNIGYSIGIRNLFNRVYHEPYTALDGIKRSFLASIRYQYN